MEKVLDCMVYLGVKWTLSDMRATVCTQGPTHGTQAGEFLQVASAASPVSRIRSNPSLLVSRRQPIAARVRGTQYTLFISPRRAVPCNLWQSSKRGKICAALTAYLLLPQTSN